MKRINVFAVLIIAVGLPAIVSAQVPGIINYQGRVTVGGTNFDGTGSFKFALVNNGATKTYWSNGVNAVSLTVTKGLYSVLLGDTGIANMTDAIPTSVFTNSDVRLRVWFDDGVSGVQQLTPDQRLAAAGYALAVANVRAVGYNTFVGQDAGNATMSGSANTAFGYTALRDNTSGDANTAIGSGALQRNTGGNNTAVGYQALYLNTSAVDNTAVGYQALNANTIGVANSAHGTFALWKNVDGWCNSAVGAAALCYNTSGSSNTAHGYQAMIWNTSGDDNTADGFQALMNNTNGIANTAIGCNALGVNTSGATNIGVGFLAGYNLTTGGNNIDIGNQGVAAEANTIRIGTQGTQTGTFIAGIFGATAPGGSSVVVNPAGKLGTSTSSRRFKDNIQTMGDASEALLMLRPVTFRYKPEIDPQGIPQFGLVAEEVEQVAPELVVRDADGRVYSVRYEQVNAMLLNEFLKQHRRVDEQGQTITELRNQNADLAKRLADLERRLNEGGK